MDDGWCATPYTYDKENDVKSIIPPTGEPIRFDYYEHTDAAVQFPNNVTNAQHYLAAGAAAAIRGIAYSSVSIAESC